MKTKALIFAALLCTFAFVLYGCGNMNKKDDETDSGTPSVSVTDDVVKDTEDSVSRETDEPPVSMPDMTDNTTATPNTTVDTTDSVTTAPDTTAPVTTAPVTQPPLPPESK